MQKSDVAFDGAGAMRHAGSVPGHGRAHVTKTHHHPTVQFPEEMLSSKDSPSPQKQRDDEGCDRATNSPWLSMIRVCRDSRSPRGNHLH